MKKILILTFFFFLFFPVAILFSQENNANNMSLMNGQLSIDQVKELVEKGANVKAVNSSGNTALHNFASFANIDVVKYLVEKGADVNAKNNSGQTPLYYAVIMRISTIKQNDENPKNFYEVVKFLISKGADIFERDIRGKNVITSYFQYKRLNSDLDLIKLFLNKDNINKQDKYGVTPLHCAITSLTEQSDLGIIKFICEDCKADTNILTNEGLAPLHLAAKIKRYDLMTLLINNSADINLKTTFDKSALQIIIENDNTLVSVQEKDKLKEFIKNNKIDINDIYKGIDSPLHFKLLQGNNADRIKALLDIGISINIPNKTNQTPLHIAGTIPPSHYGEEFFKYLLDYEGADVNAKDDQGNTLLHYFAASEFNSMFIIKYLIEKKEMSVNEKNNFDQTPLFELLKSRKPLDIKFALLKYFIDSKADINITDKYLSTPMHVLAESKAFNQEMIQYLLEKGVKINSQNQAGKTALLILTELSTNLYYYNNYSKLIKCFIKHGADVGIKDNNNGTVFVEIVRHNLQIEPDTLKELIKHGNDIDWSKDNTISPVCWALLYSTEPEVIKYFHKTKADFKKNSRAGESPLFILLVNGMAKNKNEVNLDSIKSLVECGASVDEGKLLFKPLEFLLRHYKPNLEAVKYLVENGADVSKKTTSEGLGVLHILMLPASVLPASHFQKSNYESEILEITKYLVEHGADINLQDKIELARPIHFAALSGLYKLVKYFADQKIQLNVKTITGETPLHFALSGNNIKIDLIKFLIENGCSVNDRNKNNLTPLLSATKNASIDLEIVKYLCEEANAEINIKDNDGNTPILSALKFTKKLELIKYFIDRGADVTTLDNEKRNPLHCLLIKVNNFQRYPLLFENRNNINLNFKDIKAINELVTHFIKAGVDINLIDKNGMTPLHYAFSDDNQFDVEIISMLIRHGADAGIKNNREQSAVLLILLSNQSEKMIKEIMKLLNVNFSNKNYETLLHEMVNSNYESLQNIKYVIQSGYPINSRDRFGSTPLHIIVMRNKSNDKKIIKWLIENGADVNAKDNNGATPLHDAAESCFDSQVVEILIEAGADIYAKDIFNMTPLDLVGTSIRDVKKETILKNAQAKAQKKE